MNPNYFIDPDIHKASTLHADFYRSNELFERMQERIFARTWQWVGDENKVRVAGQVYPFTYMPGLMEEPLLLTRDDNDQLHCMSNVCTHRGNLLVEHEAHVNHLQCRYHGRKFNLDGTFKFMPECADCENFPTAADNLQPAHSDQWQQFLFASLDPKSPLHDFVKPMTERLSFLDIKNWQLEPAMCREYVVKSNWMLYCDNYMEGFHIPFIHNSLSDQLDYGSYVTELFPMGSLQTAISKTGENYFTGIPSGHPDFGKKIAAYYFWMFPNIMFNFYPWGLSVNVVRPMGIGLSKVSFISYLANASKLGEGAGAGLDRVEREDESIVENVQKGMTSRYYTRGRYSPKREQGVHHFHRMLLDWMWD